MPMAGYTVGVAATATMFGVCNGAGRANVWGTAVKLAPLPIAYTQTPYWFTVWVHAVFKVVALAIEVVFTPSDTNRNLPAGSTDRATGFGSVIIFPTAVTLPSEPSLNA